MDETFDPDDQFFQAFKAGYILGVKNTSQNFAPPLDQYLWDEYITWLKGEA